MTSIAHELGATLSRATIVRLKPRSQVYPHIDIGSYYRIRDRYHLVLYSPSGSLLFSGDEQVRMRSGELWWFDNKEHHVAYNESDEWRIHYIFDLLPAAHKHLGINPQPLSALKAAINEAKSGGAHLSGLDVQSNDGGHPSQHDVPQANPIISKLGEIAWLFSQSQHHKHYAVSDFDTLVIPPLRLGQFRMYYSSGKPAGVALWAMVSEETALHLQAEKERRLSPQEWRSGDKPWLVELIAPFGSEDQMLKDLKAHVFSNHPLKVWRTQGDQKILQTF